MNGPGHGYYQLLQPAAQVSRERSAELNRGKKRKGMVKPLHVRYANAPASCECPNPWRNGEGRCSYCGKTLRDPRLRELGP